MRPGATERRRLRNEMGSSANMKASPAATPSSAYWPADKFHNPWSSQSGSCCRHPPSNAKMAAAARGMAISPRRRLLSPKMRRPARVCPKSSGCMRKAALAHVIQNKAEAAYARSDVFEKRRKMMESWAGYLEARRGEVVKLETTVG